MKYLKYLKWLLVVPIVASPLLFWFDPDRAVLCGLLAFLCVLPAFFLQSLWTDKELAWTALVVKALHLFPSAYTLGVTCLSWVFSAWAAADPNNPMFSLGLLVSFLSIFFLPLYILSALPGCLLGLAAVLRCRKEGRLTSTQTAIYGVLQFVLLADVVCAILLCRAALKKEVS